MNRRKIFIPLFLLILITLLSFSASASFSDNDVVDLEYKSEGHLYFDGRDYDTDALSDEDFTVYHRFSVDETALMHLYGDSYFSRSSYWEDDMHGDFTLYNSEKEKLYKLDYDEDDDYGDAYSYFVLKPGTYYLRYDGFNPYKLHLKYEYCDRKIAKTKKKARSIGKKVSGYFYRGEKDVHWYKIKLKKKQYIDLTFDAYGSGQIFCYIYGKGIKNNSAYAWCYDASYNDEYGTTKGKKLSPGTYYFKVMRKKSNISGQYTIRWK